MTKQCPIYHRTIPNIAPTLRELFSTEFHITTRQCPTHHKAMSHSIQSDAPIPLGECLQTEIQPITRQWLTHYRTVSNPLEDRFTKKSNPPCWWVTALYWLERWFARCGALPCTKQTSSVALMPVATRPRPRIFSQISIYGYSRKL